MRTEQQIREEIKRLEELQLKASDSYQIRYSFGLGIDALKWVLKEGEKTD